MSDDHAQGGNSGGADNSGTPAPGSAPENAGGSSGIKFGGAPAGSGDGGSDAGNSDWLASLSDDNKQVATQRGWKSADDMAKSYRELETKFSARDPAKGSDPQGGKAPQAGDYVFKTPANAKDMGYNEDFANQFKSWSAEKGVAPEVAAFYHDKFVEYAGSSIGQQTASAQEALSARLADTEKTLTKAWGSTNTPAFQRNVQLAERAAQKLGIMDALTESGVFVKSGNETSVANAAIFEALAKVGNTMYAEDELHGAANDGVNPFDGGSEQAVSALVRSDPAKALMLINQLPAEKRARWTTTAAMLKRKAQM